MHGCRQLVSWDVELSPATSATLILYCFYFSFLFFLVMEIQKTAGLSRRKVRTTSSQHAPYILGDTRATMAATMSCYFIENKLISKKRPKFGLQAATRLYEVGINSNRRSATLRWMRPRVLYTPPVTPRKLIIPKIITLTFLRRGMPKVFLVTRVKS